MKSEYNDSDSTWNRETYWEGLSVCVHGRLAEPLWDRAPCTDTINRLFKWAQTSMQYHDGSETNVSLARTVSESHLD
jgi:hypothetical protein